MPVMVGGASILHGPAVITTGICMIPGTGMSLGDGTMDSIVITAGIVPTTLDTGLVPLFGDGTTGDLIIGDTRGVMDGMTGVGVLLEAMSTTGTTITETDGMIVADA